MDVLKDKQFRQYNYISRYTSFPVYYHTKDEKYVYGITSQLRTDTPYVSHSVTQFDNLDSLSFKYYGRPDYYWIIADFNRIQDPFTNLFEFFTTIKIPSLTTVGFEV
jgi:hypothetical protein